MLRIAILLRSRVLFALPPAIVVLARVAISPPPFAVANACDDASHVPSYRPTACSCYDIVIARALRHIVYNDRSRHSAVLLFLLPVLLTIPYHSFAVSLLC